MRLEIPVVVIWKTGGQVGKEFATYGLAEQFMEEQLVDKKAFLNDKDKDCWYIENDEASYELRYTAYED